MRKIVSLIFFLAILTPSFAENQFEKQTPKLVLNLIVDGIQTEHIATLWNYFDDRGIKRIFRNGLVFTDQHFNYYSGGSASDMATFSTGATPNFHGIIGNNFFQKKTKETISIVSDERYVGIGTQYGYSPENLYASTVSDELKLVTNGVAKVFAIAPNAEDAILLGGRAANAAIWIDNQFGKLATSSYYNYGLPSWCNEINIDGTMEQLVNFNWTPLFSSFTYNYPAANQKNKNVPFEYNASNYKNYEDAIKIFKQTPYANKVMRRLTIKAIQEENLGNDNTPDILSVKFTLNPPIETAHELLTAEKEDMYLRFDKEIKNLLDTVEHIVGLSNTLIVLTGTQCINLHPATLNSQKLHNGVFNAGRAMALLNNYLMLLHGQGNWVTGYHAKNIYLNERLAEQKKIDFRLIEYQAQRFMAEFQGVASVYITNNLYNISGLSETEKVKNSIHSKKSGTIYFTLLPGWIEVDNNNEPIGISGRNMISAPLLFYGWNLHEQKINTPVMATDIAPTISQILKITKPNACVGKIIPFLFE